MQKPSKISEIESDADFQFFNCQINQNAGSGNLRTPASITINRSTPILNYMENFYVSVGRMTFPALTVPLMVAPLVVGSNYATGQMIYSFNLIYKTFSSGQVFVTWQPSVLTASPGTGLVQQSLQSLNPYYYVYTVNRFCDMMNAALDTAFTALGVASGGTLPLGAVAPLFYWSVELQSIVLYVKNSYDTVNAAFPIYICFNNQLAPLLNGFEFNHVADNEPNGLDNQFVIIAGKDNIDPADITFLDIKPFAFDLSYWTIVNGFQVTTSMPVNYENIQPINYDYGMPSTLSIAATQNTNPNPASNILTDFVPDWQNPQNFNALFIYNKTDQWRYAVFSSSGPLSTFTLNLFWTDIAGNQIPLYLNPGTTASLKIGFFKKSLLNSQGEKLLQEFKRGLYS